MPSSNVPGKISLDKYVDRIPKTAISREKMIDLLKEAIQDQWKEALSIHLKHCDCQKNGRPKSRAGWCAEYDELVPRAEAPL